MSNSLSRWSRSITFSLACTGLALGLSSVTAQVPEKPVLVKEFRLLADKIKLPLKAVAISRDGKVALSMSTGPAVLGLGPQLWDIDTGKPGKKLDIKESVDSLAISNDGKRAIFSFEDGTLHLWDLTAAKEIRTFKGNILGGVRSLTFSPDGKLVVSGGGPVDEKIRLWEAASGKELAQFKGNKRAAPALAFSADGARLATGGLEGDLRIWDVKSRKQIHLCEGHTKLIQSVSFSPDGKQVLTGGADSNLRIWDATTGKEIGKLDDAAGSVNTAAYLPDGLQAFTGSGGEFDVELLPTGVKYRFEIGKSQALRLIDLKSGKAIFDMPDPGRPVLNVSVAPKGRVIVVTYEGILKVWQMPDTK